MKMTFRILPGLLLALLCACSSDALRGAGTSCTSDGDCAAGLNCLGLGVASDGGCSTAISACSKTCQTDADCVSVGAKFRCFAGCGTPSSCGQTP